MSFSAAARRRADARVLLASLGVLATTPALAGSNTIGVTVTSERVPGDFDATKSTDTQVSYAHSFDNHVILGGLVKYYDTANTSAYKVNVEGGIGYSHAVNDVLSLTGMASVGSHMPSDASDFAYYSLTGSLNLKLTPVITWSVVTARYRNAFDTANAYETPELGTALDFKINDANSVSLKVARDWSNGEVSYNAIEVGYKYHF